MLDGHVLCLYKVGRPRFVFIQRSKTNACIYAILYDHVWTPFFSFS